MTNQGTMGPPGFLRMLKETKEAVELELLLPPFRETAKHAQVGRSKSVSTRREAAAFLMEVLNAANTRLQSSDAPAAVVSVLATFLFEALDGLWGCRELIKGGPPTGLVAQRYTAVRRLLSSKLFDKAQVGAQRALQEALELLSTYGGGAMHDTPGSSVILDEAAGLALSSFSAGVAACVEGGTGALLQALPGLEQAATAVSAAASRISSANAEKEWDAVFRYLYKGSLAAAAEATRSQAPGPSTEGCARLFRMTLDQCVASPNRTRTLQVAGRIAREARGSAALAVAVVVHAAKLAAAHGPGSLGPASDLFAALEALVQSAASSSSSSSASDAPMAALLAAASGSVDAALQCPGAGALLAWTAALSGSGSDTKRCPGCSMRTAASSAVQRLAATAEVGPAGAHVGIRCLSLLKKIETLGGGDATSRASPCAPCPSCRAALSDALDAAAPLAQAVLSHLLQHRRSQPGPEPLPTASGSGSAATSSGAGGGSGDPQDQARRDLWSATSCLVVSAEARSRLLLDASRATGGPPHPSTSAAGEVTDPDRFSVVAAAAARGLLKPEDLSWSSAAMQNVASALSRAKLVERTVVPMRVSWELSRAAILTTLAVDAAGPCPLPLQLDLCRRAVALSDSLRRLGGSQAAAHASLALHVICASLATICSTSSPDTSAVLPLVRAHVRTSTTALSGAGTDEYPPSLISVLQTASQEQAPSMPLSTAADILLEQLREVHDAIADLPAEGTGAEDSAAVRAYLAHTAARVSDLLLTEIATEAESPVRRARALSLLARQAVRLCDTAGAEGAAGSALQALGGALAGPLRDDSDLSDSVASDAVSVAAQFISILMAGRAAGPPAQVSAEAADPTSDGRPSTAPSGADPSSDPQGSASSPPTAPPPPSPERLDAVRRIADVAREVAEILEARYASGPTPPAPRVAADLRALGSISESLSLLGLAAPQSAVLRAAQGISAVAARCESGSMGNVVSAALLWLPSAAPLETTVRTAAASMHPLVPPSTLLFQLTIAAAQGPEQLFASLMDQASRPEPPPSGLAAAAASAASSLEGPVSECPDLPDTQHVRAPLARAELFRLAAIQHLAAGRVLDAHLAADASLRQSASALSRLRSPNQPRAAGDVSMPGSTLASGSYVRALLLYGDVAESLGATDDAVQALHEARQMGRGLGSGPLEAYALLRLARLHAREGRSDKAGPELDAAVAIVSAWPWAAAADAGSSGAAASGGWLEAEVEATTAEVASSRGLSRLALDSWGRVGLLIARLTVTSAGPLPACVRWALERLRLSAEVGSARESLRLGDMHAATAAASGALRSLSSPLTWGEAGLALTGSPAAALGTLTDATNSSARPGSRKKATARAPSDQGAELDTLLQAVALPSSHPALESALLQVLTAAHLSRLGYYSRAAAQGPSLLGLRPDPALEAQGPGMDALLAAASRSVLLADEAPLELREASEMAATCCDAAGLPQAAAMFLHLSTGCGARTQAMMATRDRLAGVSSSREGSAEPDAAARRTFEGVRAALRNPLDGLCAAASPQVRRLQDLLEEGVARRFFEGVGHDFAASGGVPVFIGALSPPGSAAVNEAGCERLVISRCSPGLHPVTVAFPFPAPRACHPSAWHGFEGRDAESDMGDAPEYLSSPAALSSHLSSLLADSARTMRPSDFPLDTLQQRQRWWRARLEVDRRMGLLIRHLEAHLLGPWAFLLAPSVVLADGELAAVKATTAGLWGSLSGHLPQAASSPGAARVGQALLAALMDARTEPALSARLPVTASAVISAVWSSLSPGGEGAQGSAPPDMTAGLLAALAEAAGPDPEVHPAGRKQRHLPSAPVPFRLDKAATIFQPLDVPVEVVRQTSENKGGGGARHAPVPAATPAPPTARRPSRLKALGAVATPGPAAAARTMRTLTMEETPAPTALKTRARMQDTNPGPGGDPMDISPLPNAQAPTQPHTGVKAAAPHRDGAAASPTAPPKAPLLLVLGSSLHALPWEAMPCLRGSGARVYRPVSLLLAQALASRWKGADGPGMQGGLATVDPSRTYYLVDPAGDLKGTREAFAPWFATVPGWSGEAGTAPPPPALKAALTDHSLFAYMGHGAGVQFIPPRVLRKMDRCAAAILAGCSSGRLREMGRYDPWGPVLAYLLAGCPAAVANLWDVTDKDIDRYSKRVLSHWIPVPPGSGKEAAGQAGGEGSASDPSDEEGEGRGSRPTGGCMAAAVGSARSVCKLPHLIGAAPVCYGIPILVLGPSDKSPF